MGHAIVSGGARATVPEAGILASDIAVGSSVYLMENGVAVETEIEVPQEDIQPDLTPLDLNSATEAELMDLPGIGEELARRIVEYRENNGPFSAVEDIMQVSGIGESKFAGLKDRVTVVREETE